MEHRVTEVLYDLLLAAVCENPHDHAAKLVLADWLEEQGDPRCEAWRWIAANDGGWRGATRRDWETLVDAYLAARVATHKLNKLKASQNSSSETL